VNLFAPHPGMPSSIVDSGPFDFGGLPGAIRQVWKDGTRVRPRGSHLASA
jgi:hypothetical protein